MTVIVFLNLILALAVVIALAAVCRIPYRLASVGRARERLAAADPSPAADFERRAA
jgi:hypothetical protein